jgi:uncharacterized protein
MFIIPESSYVIKKLPKKGRGVFAVHDIAMGTVIGSYGGTIIRSNAANERKDGLYDMAGGARYDILADPKRKDLQLVNHSCANNCDMYPHKGHILYFALRKIFAGEELTVNYALSTPDDDMPCGAHACHCGSRFCKGTMHDNWTNYEAWEVLLKKEFGKWYRKVPGKYGTELQPLASYPAFIKKDYPAIYPIFGSEKKSAVIYKDSKLPSINELRKRIREIGRFLILSKLRLHVYGVRDNMLIAERI